MRRSLPPVVLALATCASAQDCAPELTSSVGALGAFGSTLAAEGWLLAVGAPEPDAVPGTLALYPYGRAELIEYDPGLLRWRPVDVLAPPPSPLTVVNHPGFASALALDGDTLLAGWPDDITGGNGTARPYRRTNGGWTAEAPLVPPFASAAHLFERDPVADTWSYTGRCPTQGAAGTPQRRAGAAVAIGAWHAAVGAPGAELVRATPACPQRDVDADSTTDACEARFDLADCWLLPNSTGRRSRIHVDGSVAVAAGNMQLAVDQLPLNAFGYFIVSRINWTILPPGGFTQILCLGGPIGRVIGPGQIMNSGPAGRAHLTLDPRQIPTPSGHVSAQPDETWYFQLWHRDLPFPAGYQSGFTETARVRFE